MVRVNEAGDRVLANRDRVGRAESARLLREFRHLRHRRILETKATGVPLCCKVDRREEFFQGRNQGRIVMYIPSPGCEWAFRGHGCNMCGHYLAQPGAPIPWESAVEQFRIEFRGIDWSHYPILNLYNNGSFLNDNELPGEVRREILSIVAGERAIRLVVVESRPRFVTDENIRGLRDALLGKRVEVAVGLEALNPVLRNRYLGKGVQLRDFERSIAVIDRYAFSRAYVLLKPPFVTEAAAIEDAVDTIAYAFSHGVHVVSLEPASVQNGTLLEYLWQKGKYSPPRLWSIVEVVRRTAGLGKLVTGLFQFHPSPVLVPYNCPECSDRTLAVLREYNRTLSVKAFDDLPRCNCYEEWKQLATPG